MAVLVRARARSPQALWALPLWALALLVALCAACALPGPPRPPPSSARALSRLTIPPTALTRKCPALAVVEATGDGLRLDVTLPAAAPDAPLPLALVVVATADGATATERVTVRLDGRLDPIRRAGGVLPLLDTEWGVAQAAEPTALRAQLTFPGADDATPDSVTADSVTAERVPCEASPWALLPTVAPAAWPLGLDAPLTLDAVGRVVRLRLPEEARGMEGEWRLLRRALSGEEGPAQVIARGWRPARDGLDGVFVDVSAQPGRVYAYSAAPEVEVSGEVEGRAVSLRVVGPPSPEAYAVIAAPPEP